MCEAFGPSLQAAKEAGLKAITQARVIKDLEIEAICAPAKHSSLVWKKSWLLCL